MTREQIEQLNKVEPYCFGTDREEQWYKVGLIEGLRTADANPKSSPWISVEDDLPHYHKELIESEASILETVLVIVWNGVSAKIDYMYYDNKEWKWCHNKSVTHWMPISKPTN